MPARFFFSLCLLVTIAFAAKAPAQLPGKWITRAPMPSARTEVAAVELGGKIYVIGGYDKGSHLVEEYDPATDSWRGRASLPKPLHHVGAAALNGKIYVIGGYISGVGPVDTVYEYAPGQRSWTMKKAMPTARGALAVGVVVGKIYAVGGDRQEWPQHRRPTNPTIQLRTFGASTRHDHAARSSCRRCRKTANSTPSPAASTAITIAASVITRNTIP